MANSYTDPSRSTSDAVVNSNPSRYGYIKKKMEEDWKNNQNAWNKYQREGSIDTNLEAGVAYSTQNYAMPLNNQTPFYFNRVRPLLNMISGWQRRNRKSSIVVPLENADQATADQWTKILMGVYKREGVYELLSDAFHQGSLVTGLSLIHVYLDFTQDDMNGDVKYDHLAYNQFDMDTFWTKHDLSDCNWIRRRSYLTHQAAASLMPDKYRDSIMALTAKQAGANPDGKFQFAPQARGSAGQKLLNYDEYYYRDFRRQKRLIDKATAESIDVTEQDIDAINLFLDLNPTVYLQEKDIPTVRMAIQIQDKIYYDGAQSTMIDSYPFVPMIGYYNPALGPFSDRIQGVCRSLRDPQALLNRRIILSDKLLDAQVNSGWKFKEGAPLDVMHLFQTGAGAVIPVKKGFELADIEQIQPPQIPPSFFQMQETFSKELNMVSGVSEENMGQIVDDQASGFKAALRQSAGMTSLEPIFDRLNFTQNLTGNITMEIIRKNYSPRKIAEMLEGEEPAPLFFNKSFGRYHCMVEQGFNTESQRQMEFAQLMQLREAGVAVTDKDIIMCATIQKKNELIENMQQQQQQLQEQQQKQDQAMMEEQKARATLAYARAGADHGLELERTSRVEENRAMAIQKLAEADRDQEQALLNKVKILKEIEDIDFGHLERLMSLVTMMKESESAIAQAKINKPA